MKLTGERNQCGACHQYFNSTSLFIKHRVGEHGKDRRCMTPAEMEAKGWKKNQAGFLIANSFPRHKFQTSTPQPDATQEP